MAADVNADDFDAQDAAEAFDETFTEGDANFGEPTNPDVKRDVLDTTYALGDGDTDDESAALDENEITDEELEDLEADGDEDDLDDDNRGMGPTADENVPDFTADVDTEDEDLVDGVAAHSRDEAEVIAMGDINDLAALGSGGGLAELEPDDVSDEDLEELGYKERE